MKMIKSKNVRRLGYVTIMGQMRNAFQTVTEHLQETRLLVDVGLDWKVVLRLT